MCQAGAREHFRPGYGRLQSTFEEQERGQKRRANAAYHHGDPTCMWYRCESLPGPDHGGTLAIYLKDGDGLSCGCSGETICRIGRSRQYVVFNVGLFIVAQLAKFRVQAATRSNERMPAMLEGLVVFVAVEAKPPGFSEGISARRKEAAPKERIVCLKRDINDEQL